MADGEIINLDKILSNWYSPDDNFANARAFAHLWRDHHAAIQGEGIEGQRSSANGRVETVTFTIKNLCNRNLTSNDYGSYDYAAIWIHSPKIWRFAKTNYLNITQIIAALGPEDAKHFTDFYCAIVEGILRLEKPSLRLGYDPKEVSPVGRPSPLYKFLNNTEILLEFRGRILQVFIECYKPPYEYFESQSLWPAFNASSAMECFTAMKEMVPAFEAMRGNLSVGVPAAAPPAAPAPPAPPADGGLAGRTVDVGAGPAVTVKAGTDSGGTAGATNQAGQAPVPAPDTTEDLTGREYEWLEGFLRRSAGRVIDQATHHEGLPTPQHPPFWDLEVEAETREEAREKIRRLLRQLQIPDDQQMWWLHSRRNLDGNYAAMVFTHDQNDLTDLGTQNFSHADMRGITQLDQNEWSEEYRCHLATVYFDARYSGGYNGAVDALQRHINRGGEEFFTDDNILNLQSVTHTPQRSEIVFAADPAIHGADTASIILERSETTLVRATADTVKLALIDAKGRQHDAEVGGNNAYDTFNIGGQDAPFVLTVAAFITAGLEPDAETQANFDAAIRDPAVLDRARALAGEDEFLIHCLDQIPTPSAAAAPRVAVTGVAGGGAPALTP